MPKEITETVYTHKISRKQAEKIVKAFYKIPSYYECKNLSEIALGCSWFSGFDFYTTYADGIKTETRHILITKNEIATALRDFLEVDENFKFYDKLDPWDKKDTESFYLVKAERIPPIYLEEKKKKFIFW